MEMQSQQNLTSLPKESQRLVLSESRESKNRLDEMLGACLALQKLYGRDVANAGTIIDLFQRMMGEYPADKVIKAFEIWMKRSQEFPTPADIINLIRRDGKPPLRESDIIAIRKKDGEFRTRAECDMLKEWDAQQQEGWGGCNDVTKNEITLQENIRLRQQIKRLEEENIRAWDEVKQLRSIKVAKPSDVPLDEKIQRTIDDMRKSGAPQNYIDEFLESIKAA